MVDFAQNGVLGGIIANDCDNKHFGESETIQVQAITLQELLENEQAPKEIDYLSIDIEGAEERALAEFPFSTYTFGCITIERPTVFLRELFIQNRYHLVREIPELDCFYIHESVLPEYQKNVTRFGKKLNKVKRGKYSIS